jgi:DNA-binding GntR family transcriptional regulator
MPPTQYRSKADIVEEHVRELILTGELAPGEPLRISDVSRSLGVSDIPCREAFARLETEGLLRTEPHKPAVVAEVGAHELEELFAIRAQLEGLAMEQAATSLDGEQLDHIEAVLEQMEAAERDSRADDYRELNRSFHFAIYEHQPYERLTKLVRELWDSSSRCGTIFRADDTAMEASAAEHRKMFEALRTGDGPEARRVLEAQKHRACTWLLHHVDTTQNFSTPA